MINKKLITLALLLVTLFLISGVSAAENTTDSTTINSEMPVDEIQSFSNENIVKKVNDGEIIGETDNGTFTDLQKKIDAAGEGGIVNLENNYTYENTFSRTGINITNPITINGNGFTINALKQSTIFNITTSNKVILNNITFINGQSNFGGAIIFNGNIADIVINNCKFINNTATENGGAIYVKGTINNSEIKNCEFTSNIATKNGGAIYILSNCTETLFEKITFFNNKATSADGGAINFHLHLIKTT